MVSAMDNSNGQGLRKEETMTYYGGLTGAMLPFFLFISGVIYLGLSGAPDERGFWPILIASICLSMFLAKDKEKFSRIFLSGMSEPLVMVMISAWILASSIGVLMAETGFVDALAWLAGQMQLSGAGFTVLSFLLCCFISLSTGSSFATILIGGPILYPAGGMLGSELPVLAGAILAGATFGDFFAPISDTTLASALSQDAPVGATVRSRLKYILPVAIGCIPLYYLTGGTGEFAAAGTPGLLQGTSKGLLMLLIPILIIGLFLSGKNLLQGLLTGLSIGIIWALAWGLLPASRILSVDLEHYTANSILIDGINRAVGISFFTILLMGLIATLRSSGLIDRLVRYAAHRSKSARQAAYWISGITAAAVLLTTHSIVAILMTADFSKKTGMKAGLSPIHRANLMSLVVCIFPFLFPYFIPVLLMANTTASGAELGIPRVTPLETGLHNYISWGLAISTLIGLFRTKKQTPTHAST